MGQHNVNPYGQSQTFGTVGGDLTYLANVAVFTGLTCHKARTGATRLTPMLQYFWLALLAAPD